MKLKVAKLYKNVFNHFSDDRGFLNHLDFNEIKKKLNLESFIPVMQLISHTTFSNTFRGMHYQVDPFRQNKIVILHSGQILDFIVPFEKPIVSNIEKFHMNVGDMLFIPDTYAHGFLTKTHNVNIQYLMDKVYNTDAYKGISAQKYIKKFAKDTNLIISEKDANYDLELKYKN